MCIPAGRCVTRVLEREVWQDDMFSLLLGGGNVVFTSNDLLICWWSLAHGELLFDQEERCSRVSANKPLESASLKCWR